MKSTLFIMMTLLTGSATWAHGMHKHEPLTLEQLPATCQSYFKRAQTCYEKAGEKASLFHQGNTKILFQSLPAAEPAMREKLCTIANNAFADKARQLKCE